MGIFLDTSFYLGLCHPKDKYAELSLKVLTEISEGEYGLLYTSNLIISEITTLVAVRTNNNIRALNYLEKLLWGDDKLAIILHFPPELEKKAWSLFKKINTETLKNKKPISFVDISTIILCQYHHIEYIASFDSHFDKFLNRIH